MSCRAMCLAVIVSLGLHVGVGRADPPPQQPPAALKEAGKHFQRGVALYTETDYRAALVEFRRAYDTAPNSAVLYNIGQTYYQLQNYAAALVTLQRYLTESGPAALHRREVEQTLETLQSRVGKVTITTNLAGCDIAIDDEPIGKTPFPEPQLVSVGSRKVTASHAGTPPQTQLISVAADDAVHLSFTFTEPAAVPVTPIAAPGVVPDAPATPRPSNRGLIVGWSATGVLAVGAITTAVLALGASTQLKDARNSFPVSQADLDSKASTVKRYAIAADVLTGLAVVTGLITLRYTLSRSHEVTVALVPAGVSLAGTFR